MGMGTMVEGLRMEVGIPDLNKISIPRRRRGSSGSEKKEQTKTVVETPTCVLEAASILMDMAYSISNVETFSNREPEKVSSTRKRKKPTTTTASTKKPRKKMCKQSKYPSIPEMPIGMRERIVEMGGNEIQLVIQKQITYTDVNKNHGRLSLPTNKLQFDFATDEEKKFLSEEENKNKNGINVLIIDDVLEESNICLKKWKIGSGDTYCLMTHWNSLVEATALKAGDHIQLWSFRKDEEFEASCLCFALVKLGTC